jgi:hypothetical protein
MWGDDGHGGGRGISLSEVVVAQASQAQPMAAAADVGERGRDDDDAGDDFSEEDVEALGAHLASRDGAMHSIDVPSSRALLGAFAGPKAAARASVASSLPAIPEIKRSPLSDARRQGTASQEPQPPTWTPPPQASPRRRSFAVAPTAGEQQPLPSVRHSAGPSEHGAALAASRAPSQALELELAALESAAAAVALGGTPTALPPSLLAGATADVSLVASAKSADGNGPISAFSEKRSSKQAEAEAGPSNPQAEVRTPGLAAVGASAQRRAPQSAQYSRQLASRPGARSTAPPFASASPLPTTHTPCTSDSV